MKNLVRLFTNRTDNLKNSSIIYRIIQRVIEIIDYIKKQASRLVFWLFDLVFPIKCFGCGQEGQWLCPECFNKISFNLCQKCPACQEMNHWGEYCQDCHQYLDGILVMSSYELEIIKKMIKTYKYRFVKDLHQPLANLMIVFIGQILETNSQLARTWSLPKFLDYFDYNIVMPVPLSKKRLAWRGFNQSELIAKQIADYFSLSLDINNLQKIKHTKPQADLKKQQRIENIKNCFVFKGNRLDKQNIILIDDLTTTGSTLNECAKILKQNGAGEVWALVLAKN